MITHKELTNALNYNKDTGVFKWNNPNRPGVNGSIVAGCKSPLGYVMIGFNGKRYWAHRLAWFYVKGYFPENEIDHKNKIRDDNRIKNLREVTHQCNLRNSKNRINNTSGVKGVSWNKRVKSWFPNITVNAKTHGLGYYKDFDDAVCARLAAEQCLGWNGCESNSPAYKYVYEIK